MARSGLLPCPEAPFELLVSFPPFRNYIEHAMARQPLCKLLEHVVGEHAHEREQPEHLKHFPPCCGQLCFIFSRVLYVLAQDL